MEDYILISQLNDFIFCPYSIYLHNVYSEAEDEVYYATPQEKGRAAHETIDNRSYSTRQETITSMSIYSHELRIMGKIDIYKRDEARLIERKNQLKTIYQGQIYQLHAQYFCMVEMGYKIDYIEFYSMIDRKSYPQMIPNERDRYRLKLFLDEFRNYDPSNEFVPNMNKCRYCIYSTLCDKTIADNVYT